MTTLLTKKLKLILVISYVLCLPSLGYAETKMATFAGGCFWCMQPAFDQLKGVNKTIVGYTGGTVENPSYEQVVAGDTGHAEAIQIFRYGQSKTDVPCPKIYTSKLRMEAH